MILVPIRDIPTFRPVLIPGWAIRVAPIQPAPTTTTTMRTTAAAATITTTMAAAAVGVAV